jgi:hypothetical protein
MVAYLRRPYWTRGHAKTSSEMRPSGPPSHPMAKSDWSPCVVTLGLIWLFALSLIIVYREEGDVRWATIQRRLRLNAPRAPRTAEPRRKLWLWLIPLVVFTVWWKLRAAPLLSGVWTSIFPFFVCGQRRLQHIPGGGTPFPRRAATQDERYLWSVGVVGKWRSLRPVPPPSAVGNVGVDWRRGVAVCASSQDVQEHLDVDHRPLHAKRVLPISDSRPRAGFGMTQTNRTEG